MSFGLFDALAEIRIPQPPTTNLNLNCFSKPAGFSGSKPTYQQQPHSTQLSHCKVFTVSTVSAVLQRTCQTVIATHRHNEQSKFTIVACCTNSIVCSLKTAEMSRNNPRLSWRVRLCLFVARRPCLWVRRLSTVTSFFNTAQKIRSYLFLKMRHLAYLTRQSPYLFGWKKPLKGSKV
jgi:hypothetical protein